MKNWYVTDNGFSDIVSMDKSHQPIVDCAVEVLSGKGGNVIDFGCGNAALLKKIYSINQNITPFGTELDPQRAVHIKDVLPSSSIISSSATCLILRKFG